MEAQPAANLSSINSREIRPGRTVAAALTLALVCSGVTSCTKTQVGLSVTAIAAVLVGTTVGVTLAVQHSHHTLQGCIVSNAASSDLELRMSDGKRYTLKGDLADIKVGDKLKLHGSKVKKVKGPSAGSQVFVVEKINKDYGPCPAP